MSGVVGKEPSLREKLAELEHEQWSEWIIFLSNIVDAAGHAVFLQNMERWKRQAKTSYDKLSEIEKDADRKFADKVLKVFGEAFTLKGSVEVAIKAKAKTFMQLVNEIAPKWERSWNQVKCQIENKQFVALDGVLGLLQQDREEHNKQLQELREEVASLGLVNIHDSSNIEYEQARMDIEEWRKRILKKFEALLSEKAQKP